MNKRLDIYIDGSHLNKQNKGEDRLGCGGVLVDLEKSDDAMGMGTEIDSFSIHLLPDYMKMSFGAENPSNPGAELVAVLQALQHFKSHLKNASEIVIHADYSGVSEWMNGNWRIKEPYIRRIKDAIIEEIGRQGLRGRIKYAWVKGHQKDINGTKDAYWNAYADLKARGDR